MLRNAIRQSLLPVLIQIVQGEWVWFLWAFFGYCTPRPSTAFEPMQANSVALCALLDRYNKDNLGILPSRLGISMLTTHCLSLTHDERLIH
jgi:heme A synthase